jgi:hypothetical protein
LNCTAVAGILEKKPSELTDNAAKAVRQVVR